MLVRHLYLYPIRVLVPLMIHRIFVLPKPSLLTVCPSLSPFLQAQVLSVDGMQLGKPLFVRILRELVLPRQRIILDMLAIYQIVG